MLNISSRTLSKMILSNDQNQIHCVSLIRNLAESLKDYPEQLSEYIIQIQSNPISKEDILPFFELICPQIINNLPINEYMKI